MRIISKTKSHKISVVYYGETFVLRHPHKYIATDKDGTIHSYSGVPLNDSQFGELFSIWTVSEEDDCCDIGKADLQDTDWKDTLVKV